MAAAILGLTGVVAGALLGGLLTYRSERNKKRMAAWFAGRQIANQLRVYALRVEDALKQGRWQSLSTDLWGENAEALAQEMPARVFDNVDDVYRLIGEYNTQATHIDELTKFQGEITRVEEELRARLRLLRPVRATRALANWSDVLPFLAAITLFVVVVGGGWALFASRPYLNEATVAGALRQQFGSGSIVDCDAQKGDWLCSVGKASEATASCSSSLYPASLGPAVVNRLLELAPAPTTPIPPPSPRAGTCEGTATVVNYDVVDEGGYLVGTLQEPDQADDLAGEPQSSDLAGQQTPVRQHFIVTKEPKTSWIAWIWDRVTGGEG
jgi:hypothetical protein